MGGKHVSNLLKQFGRGWMDLENAHYSISWACWTRVPFVQPGPTLVIVYPIHFIRSVHQSVPIGKFGGSKQSSSIISIYGSFSATLQPTNWAMILEPKGHHVWETPNRAQMSPVLSRGVGELPLAITKMFSGGKSLSAAFRVALMSVPDL